MKSTTTHQRPVDFEIFNDLNIDDNQLMEGCMSNIIIHVDKNIERSDSPAHVTRLLTVRWLINRNLKRLEN